MKKKYLILALFLASMGQVQAQNPAVFSVPMQQVDQQDQAYVLAPLDKSQIPTGFLSDYAIPLVPLDVFNGTLTDSSRTTPNGFRALYGTAYTANIYGTNPLPTLQTLNSRVSAAVATAGTTIPLMVQRIGYAAIRADAFSANLLSLQNGQAYDVPGRTASPYEQRVVFAAAPATNYSASGTVSFVFQQDLFIQSAGASPSTLGVDFGDGRGYVTTTFGQPVAASYATAGTKRIKVRAGYRLSTFFKTTIYYESHFDMEVAQANVACTNCRYTTPVPNVNFPAVPGVHSGATVSIRYGGNHTQLTKPLIVVEGYDKHHVAPSIQKENYSITQFLQEISTPGNYNFGSDLDNLGQYDIVFIDFKNGTDDLLRNAMVFEEVVNYVNSNKVGGIAAGQHNAVMGVSMGGLIARYKLAEMTKASRNSHTRLLLLHDSPQRGANVPLGIQALTRQAVFNIGPFSTADASDELREGNLLLDEPATRQLLVHRATDAFGGFQANTFLDGVYRPMITFTGGSLTPAYRTVAVSQGSQCGVGLFAPYAEMIRVNGRLFVSPLPWISRVSYETEVIVNALPAGGQSSRVAYMVLKQRLRMFFGLVDITRNLFQRSYTCPSGLLAWDGVPGGTEPVSGVPGGFLKRFGGSWLPFVEASLNVNVVESFSFLPTASGLDASVLDQNSLQNAYIYGANSTPQVDKFIAQESFTTFNRLYYNQPHTIFTDRNGQWMFNELEGRSNTVLNCTSQCNPYPLVPINGPNVICSGTAAGTYVITPPFGSVTGWTVSPAGLVTTSSTTGGSPTLTVTPTGTGSGVITITAQLGNGCLTRDSQPLQVAIGTGRIQVTASATTACPGIPLTFIAQAIGTNTDFEWSINNVVNHQYDGLAEIEVDARAGGTSAVASASSCTSRVNGRAFVSSPNLPPGRSCAVRGTVTAPVVVMAYPNPAHETLTVQRQTIGAGALTIRLYDAYSRERLTGQLTGTTLQLDTRELQPGIYFLHTLDGTRVLNREQIQIK
ncbi:T9SS type A sorting domain-containing protein [Hymenobacter algoricola]|uniref:Secretion system C-terminal sorting domain-containing protein n=1 Tax=Hymenobacter algoricola TaxID=486267 RepID=A0ABP7N6G9_9BACT